METARDGQGAGMTDPMRPKTAQEAAEAFMRGVPTGDPKLPEPVHQASYYCNKCGHYGPTGPAHANCNYNAVHYGPHYSAEQMQAYAEALAAARVAQERERTYTRAQLLSAMKAERYACSIAVWMTLQDALADDADDKGLDGWMREAEQRIKARMDASSHTQPPETGKEGRDGRR